MVDLKDLDAQIDEILKGTGPLTNPVPGVVTPQVPAPVTPAAPVEREEPSLITSAVRGAKTPFGVSIGTLYDSATGAVDATLDFGKAIARSISGEEKDELDIAIDEIISGVEHSIPASQREGILGEIGKGVSRGVDQLQAAVPAVQGIVAEAMGDDEAAQQRFLEAKAKQAEGPKSAVPSLRHIRGWDDFGYWFSKTLGEQGPIMLATIASGGAGGMSARLALRKYIGDSIARRAFVTKVGTISGAYPTAAGLVGAEAGMEFRDATGSFHPELAIPIALTGGALETLTPFMILKRMTGFGGGAAAATPGFVRGAVTLGASEGSTELAQNELTMQGRGLIDPDFSLTDADAWWRRAEALGAGFAVGGVTGPITTLGERRVQRQEGGIVKVDPKEVRDIMDQQGDLAPGPVTQVEMAQKPPRSKDQGLDIKPPKQEDFGGVGEVVAGVGLNWSQAGAREAQAKAIAAYDEARTSRYVVVGPDGNAHPDLVTEQLAQDIVSISPEHSIFEVDQTQLDLQQISAGIEDVQDSKLTNVGRFNARVYGVEGELPANTKINVRQFIEELEGVDLTDVGNMERLSNTYDDLLASGVRIVPTPGANIKYSGSVDALNIELADTSTVQERMEPDSFGHIGFDKVDIPAKQAGSLGAYVLDDPDIQLTTPIQGNGAQEFLLHEYPSIPVEERSEVTEALGTFLQNDDVAETSRKTSELLGAIDRTVERLAERIVDGPVKVAIDNKTLTRDADPFIIESFQKAAKALDVIRRDLKLPKVDFLVYRDPNGYFEGQYRPGTTARRAQILLDVSAMDQASILDAASKDSVGRFITSTMLHEFGHHISITRFNNAPYEIQEAVWNAWRRDKAAADSALATGSGGSEVLRIQPQLDVPPSELVLLSMSQGLNANYYSTFPEYMAEQLRRYLQTNHRSLNLIEKFYREGANILKKTIVAWNKVAGKMGMPKYVADYINNPVAEIEAFGAWIRHHERDAPSAKVVKAGLAVGVSSRVNEQVHVPTLRRAMEQAIQPIRNAAPAEVGVELTEQAPQEGEVGEVGKWFSDLNLIQLSVAAMHDFRGIFAHEALHAVRSMGLMEDGEFDILLAEAKKLNVLPRKLRKEYRGYYQEAFKEKYKDFEGPGTLALIDRDVNEAMNEEWVAELAAVMSRGGVLTQRSISIMSRFWQLLERFKNGMNGMGFRTVQDVLSAFYSGQIAARGVKKRREDRTRPSVVNFNSPAWDRDRWSALERREFAINANMAAERQTRRPQHLIDEEVNTHLDNMAEELTDIYAERERMLRAAGNSNDEIALVMNDEFNIDITGEDLATSNVWWRAAATAHPSTIFTREMRAEISEMKKKGISNSDIAEWASDESGRVITSAQVTSAINNHRLAARKSASRKVFWPPKQIAEAVWLLNEGRTPEQAAVRLTQLSSEYYTPNMVRNFWDAIKRARAKPWGSRQRSGTPWTQAEVEFLYSAEAERFTYAELAEELNSQFGTERTRNSVAGKMNSLQLKSELDHIPETREEMIRSEPDSLGSILRNNGELSDSQVYATGVGNTMASQEARRLGNELLQQSDALNPGQEPAVGSMWEKVLHTTQSRVIRENAKKLGVDEDIGAPPQMETMGFKSILKKASPNDKYMVDLGLEADRITWWGKVLIGLDQLAWRNQHVEQLRDYVGLTRLWNAARQRWIARADDTVKDWNRMPEKQRNAISELSFWATEMQYLAPGEDARMPTQGELDKQAKKLGMTPEGMQVYRRVESDFQDFLTDVERVSSQNIQRTFAENPEGMQAALNELAAEMTELRKKPYFPMTRFGEWTITVRDPQDNNRVVWFSAYASQKEREQNLSTVIKQNAGLDIYRGHLPEEALEFMGMPATMIKLVKAQLPGINVTQEAWMDQLQHLMAPERTFRKRWLKRKGVAGYSRDGMRAYAHYFQGASAYLAKLEYKDGMEAEVNSLRAETIKNGSPRTRQLMVDYMQRHLKYIMEGGRDWAKIKAFTSLFHLGFSPFAAGMNLTQLPMVTMPMLSKLYGTSASIKEMGTTLDSLKRTFGHIPMKSSPSLTAAWEEMIDQGLIEAGQAPELGAYADGANLLGMEAGTKGQRALRATSYYGMWMFGKAERFVREATFHATWNLAIKQPTLPHLREFSITRFSEIQDLKGRRGFTDEEAVAFIAARDAIERTHFTYAPWARPEFMRSPAAGTVLIFFKYFQSMVYAMGNNAGAARMVGLHALAYGAMGLPFADDLDELIKAAFRMGNIHWSPERELRDQVLALTKGTMFEEVAPDLLTHGMSSYGFGLGLLPEGWGVPRFDASGNGSMGRGVPGLHGGLQALNAGQGTDTVVKETIEDMSGAAYGYLFAMAQFMSEGGRYNDLKKWERILPRSLKGPTRAYRYGTEGRERTRNGATVVEFNVRDPADMATLVGQAVGATPSKLTKAWKEIMSQRERVQFFRGRKAALLKQLDEAFQFEGQKGLARMLKKIKAYNRELRAIGEPELQIKNVRQSLKVRARARELQTQGFQQHRTEELTARRESQRFPGSPRPKHPVIIQKELPAPRGR